MDHHLLPNKSSCITFERVHRQYDFSHGLFGTQTAEMVPREDLGTDFFIAVCIESPSGTEAHVEWKEDEREGYYVEWRALAPLSGIRIR